MKFKNELIKATLQKRYKRFLADVIMADGSIITVHCGNSGSMMGLKDAGTIVWLSPKVNLKNKLPYKWELSQYDKTHVLINTALPNHIVEEAILDHKIKELTDFDHLKREVKYGENSRIDILLTKDTTDQKCYVEVKSITLKRNGTTAEFPDSVTARGAKHLEELIQMVKDGHRAVMIYLIGREDCDNFTIAGDIDPKYLDIFIKARDSGVEAYCYSCKITPKEITVDRLIPITV